MNTDSPAVTVIDWPQLEALAARLDLPGISPGSMAESEWHSIPTAIRVLREAEDWRGLLRLRRLFRPLMARDSAGAMPVFLELSEAAVEAAEQVGDLKELAGILGAYGHNLHRQGFHARAALAFERSDRLYRLVNEPFEALKNRHMTALCYRALGQRDRARQIIEAVLAETTSTDSWRSNPLQVLAWLEQDRGDLVSARALLAEAVALQRQNPDAEILLAGTLPDLGEVCGLLNAHTEAVVCFRESLAILAGHDRLYSRLEARTREKWAELAWRQGHLQEARSLLDEADDLIRAHGQYPDLMWRIEMVRGLVFLRQGALFNAWRKLRSTLAFRRSLGLSNLAFARQLWDRLARGTGLPR